MWSLPDINRMNSEAHQLKTKLEQAVRTGTLHREQLKCEWEGHSEVCDGDLRHYLWYDIFSDDPKGILTLCDHHDGYYSSPSEGYFTCDDCGRVFTENYTWELYYHCDDSGIVCLPCYAARELAEDENWIQLTDEGIESVTDKTVHKAKHLIGVKMPVPKGIRFVNNVEYDSMDGHCINGGDVEELKETLRQLKGEGSTRAILSLDAAYQFAVSIGVYVPVKGGQYDVTLEPAAMAVTQ
jgi:hypothetical protein